MTVSSTTVKNSYSGNGSNDTFVYGFKIFADTDLEVIIRSATGTETIKTLTTHYTVTGAGSASGGNVVFTAGNIPTATETVVVRREVPQTQAIDYIANDPFPAESHEEGLDRATMTIQQLQEEVNRSIKLSATNTMTSTEFTVGATDRANKILAFDSSGEIAVTQELGTYKGTDATTTTAAYAIRDMIKSTTAGQLNNVYICIADSVIGDTLTDTDHFELLVDAYSAASSATAAAASATDAETAQTAAETAQTAAELAETNAETAETNAETAETNAATSETNAATSETNAGTSETNAATSETNAGTSETNAATSASNASTSASTATTQASNASTSASNASTSETNAGTSETNAGTSASNASTSASNASTSETNAATSANEAAASADAFDDVYLGSKSSDPTTDNDGDALAAGMLYYNTTSNIMRIYSGSAWENVAVSTSGFATLAGVETLTNKTLTSPKINEDVVVTSTATELNKLDGVTSTTAELNILDGVTSTATELNKLDALSRGSIIYGNASAATSILTKGTVDQVLTSDGTDIAWGDVSGGRTGTVDWDTTPKTTTFSAVNGNGYFINTSSGAVTLNLPAGVAGAIVSLADYAATWQTNNVTIVQNGSEKIGGSTSNAILSTEGLAVTLVYVDATRGWLVTDSGNQSDTPVPTYITATGGTITIVDTDYKVHTFTGPGTFTVCSVGNPLGSTSVDYMVVAGGGGAGYSSAGGGGAGAGGFRESSGTTSGCYTASPLGACVSSLPVSVTGYPIVIGAGGVGAIPSTPNEQGSSSSFSTISSAGGGKGGCQVADTTGGDGGSGGGGVSHPGTPSAAGSGNTPPVSPSQGNPGGLGNVPGGGPTSASGGGGGATVAGGNGNGPKTGGAGATTSINGTPTAFSGGGGGASTYTPEGGGSGGVGGGGNGSSGPNNDNQNGTTNTGGGGGGKRTGDSPVASNGGSGIVIIRYKFQ